VKQVGQVFLGVIFLRGKLENRVRGRQ